MLEPNTCVNVPVPMAVELPTPMEPEVVGAVRAARLNSYTLIGLLPERKAPMGAPAEAVTREVNAAASKIMLHLPRLRSVDRHDAAALIDVEIVPRHRQRPCVLHDEKSLAHVGGVELHAQQRPVVRRHVFVELRDQ